MDAEDVTVKSVEGQQSYLKSVDIQPHDSESVQFSGGNDTEHSAEVDDDGQQHHEQQLITGDPVSDFLLAMPPNWEKAEGHGRANLVVDASKT